MDNRYALIALLLLGAAHADDTLDPIVITSSRQADQNIQLAPTAVTVVSPETIDRAGGTSLQDIAPYVPSLSLEQGGPGLGKIDIRGVTTGAADILNNLEDRPLVGVYIDDTPMAMQGFNPNLNVLDIERVEVLRGPQGTLYGASSMGGTVRYITRKPDLVSVFGSEEVVVSDTQGGGLNYGVRTDLNVPLGSKAAMLVTGYTGRDSGWINNAQDGQTHSNWDRPDQARFALRFQPTHELTLDASALLEKLSTGAANYTFSGLPKNQFASLTPTPINDDMRIYNFTGEYLSGVGRFISSTSLVNRATGFNDSGQYFTSAFYPSMPNPSPATYANQNAVTQFSQEIRFVSMQDRAIKWTLGSFFNHLVRHNYQDDNSPGFDSIEGVNSVQLGAFRPNSIFSGNEDIWEHDFGLFGETTWDITNRLRVTGGARYFDWHQTFGVYFAGMGGDVNGAPSTLAQSANANGVDPKLNVRYELSDTTMIFAEAAKGFRYGGVNQPVPNGPPPLCHNDLVSSGFPNGAPVNYGPDSLWSYSLGEKSSFAEDRIHFNATAFLIKWSNVQTEHYLPICSYAFTENAGQVQSTGYELEAAYKVTHALTVSANGSYTHAVSNGPIPNIGAQSGEQTPYVPHYLGSLNADYHLGKMRYTAEYQYHGSSGTRFNPSDPEFRSLPSYSNVNLAATLTQNSWEIGLFARNLLNTSQVTMILPDVLGSQPGDEVAFARPRTVGVRTVYRF